MGDHKNPPPPSTSPNSTSTSTSSNGNPSASLPPLTPKSNPNPNPNNPYPTTFVQADTHSFKQVVQMLTGSSETTAAAAAAANNNKIPPNSPSFPKSPIPPISRTNKKPAFKLYERRGSMKNLKMISPLIPSFSAAGVGLSPREKHAPEILSPSILDFPSLALSPVTPLSPDPFNRSPNPSIMSVEDRAIAERGFYLHPSPRATTPRGSEPPKLLPLFPLSSPRMESGSAI